MITLAAFCYRNRLLLVPKNMHIQFRVLSPAMKHPDK